MKGCLNCGKMVPSGRENLSLRRRWFCCDRCHHDYFGVFRERDCSLAEELESGGVQGDFTAGF